MAKKSDTERRLEEASNLHARGVISDEEYATRRAAIIAADNPAVSVKSGGRGVFKGGFFGCLGVIAAIVAVVVVLMIIVAIGTGSDDDSKGASPGQAGTNKGDVHVVFAANASGVIAPEGNGNKRSKVTILQSEDAVKSTNEFVQPPAGKKWWGVRVEVENVGTAEVSSLEWKLRDSKDAEHDQALVVTAGDRLDVLYTLTPGGKKQGWIYFEIDADATPKWLRADPNPFLKNVLY
ncbi:MAG: DUF4352 domain-containing protein, partial [Dehalococcoidia bacterium]|nr:DUF4352 domain-containing protein [Dehalococcoidia bacterium]